MEEEKSKAYSEVVEILKLIEDEKKIEQIPFEVIQLIKGNADPNYKPQISKEKPLEDQNLKNETYSIMAWIANKYWNENIQADNIQDYSETIKNETEKEVKVSTEISGQERKINNASVYNDIDPESLEGSNLPVLVEDIAWYEKIKIKIIKLLKMIFRIGKKEEGVNE